MNLKSMHEQLALAELDFAYFNALRTTAAENHPGIQRGTKDGFDYVVDSLRPLSTYYNRAVSRSPGALSAANLGNLPDSIVGIEVTPAQLTPESAEQLLASGFKPSHQLCYLGAAPVAVPEEQEVARLASSQTELFFDLLQLSGVDFPADKRVLKQRYYCTPQFQAFVARTADGTPCGWATMFVNGSTAFFGNSFTLPEFRHMGMHASLLAARLNAAVDLGIQVAYTDVEHGSQSHYNCERVGFRTITVNTIWARMRQAPTEP